MDYRPMGRITGTVDAFTRAYLECAEWCGLSEEDREALELAVSPKWDEASVREASDLCARFQADERIALESSGLSDERAGHDLWLTQNRHGAGFWDEGIGGFGEHLTKAAHLGGERYATFDPDNERLYLA